MDADLLVLIPKHGLENELQASQWFIPLAPHKTLLCNCLLGSLPREGACNLHSLITKVGGLVNPGDTCGCSRRRLLAWVQPPVSFLWEHLPSCREIFRRTLLSQLEK